MPDETNRPATKLDVDHLEERLIEKMRDMQTEMLRAFTTGRGQGSSSCVRCR